MKYSKQQQKSESERVYEQWVILKIIMATSNSEKVGKGWFDICEER